MSKQGGVHVWEEEVLKVRPGECSWETKLGGLKWGREGWDKRNQDMLFL